MLLSRPHLIVFFRWCEDNFWMWSIFIARRGLHPNKWNNVVFIEETYSFKFKELHAWFFRGLKSTFSEMASTFSDMTFKRKSFDISLKLDVRFVLYETVSESLRRTQYLIHLNVKTVKYNMPSNVVVINNIYCIHRYKLPPKKQEAGTRACNEQRVHNREQAFDGVYTACGVQ